MIECGQGLGLARESCQPVVVACHCPGQDLQRDVSLQPAVPGTVDLAHSTSAESIDHLVRANVLADGETHEWRRL
jgi:hypothetical protein